MAAKRRWKYIKMWQGKTELAEEDLPPIKDNQILVKIELSGLCGTDLHVWEAGYGPHRMSGAAEYPLVPGHEYVGIIEEKGPKADEVMFYHTETPEVGDRIWWAPDVTCGSCVFCRYYNQHAHCPNAWFYGFCPPRMGPRGGWATYVILEPRTDIWKLPPEVTAKEGVLTEPLAVSLRSVSRALNLLSVQATAEGIPTPSLFAVYGCGTIGLGDILLLKTLVPYSKVIALDLKKHRLEAAKKLGADYTINVAETTREERIKMIKEIADSLEFEGRWPGKIGWATKWGVDAVFDCTGVNAKDVVPEAIEITRVHGVLVETGAYVWKPAGQFTIDPHEICTREMYFVGHWAYPVHQPERAAKLVMKGILKNKADIIVTHELPLEKHEEAIRMYQAREPGIKIVFNPWL